MMGETISSEGVLEDFLTRILPKIVGKPTREALIELHIIISVNLVSVALNLGGGCHGHMLLMMAVKE